MKAKRRAVARLDVHAPEPDRRRSGTRPKQAPDEDAPLVLVVDDDPIMRETLGRMVSRSYRVELASEAAGAVAMCVRHRPALVLSDFDMPGASGRDLAALLGVVLGAAAPPVIIVTGGDTARAEGPGVRMVLPKPLGLGQLLDAIAQAIDESSG